MNYYLGIDFGGTALKIGITDNKGNIIIKNSYTTRTDGDAEELTQYYGECALSLIKESKIDKKKILGAGVGAPGLLNPETGQLYEVTNIKPLNNFLFGPALSKVIGLPVFLDNDVNAMSLAEYYYGAAKGYKHVVAITLGTGIGGGIIINGQLYRGASFTAGEVGHITHESGGLLCDCGNYGCVEQYAARDGIINRFKQYYIHKEMESSIQNFLEDGEITPKAISMAANDGDPLSKMVMAEVGTYLGITLAAIVNVLNPEIIVIGGGISQAGDLILEPARVEMLKRAYNTPAHAVKIVQAELLNDAGIIGSASIAVAECSK